MLAEWLQRASASIPTLEAQVLAAHVLGVDRSWVIAHPEAVIDPTELDSLLIRRSAGEPLPYILGWREFYGRRFAVDPRVLIPRQETEILVEMVLENVATGQKVVDIGTGSGCIALTLAVERPDLEISAVDKSADALAVARENAAEFGLISGGGTGTGPRVDFFQADGIRWLSENRVDVIVTNPPYVGLNDELGPGVAEFEPHDALFAGDSGLDFYRSLADAEWTGELFCEIGRGQGGAIRALFDAQEFVASRHDLAGIERVLHFRRRGKTSE